MKILLIADPGSVHAGKFHQSLLNLGHESRIFCGAVHFNLDEHFENQYIYIQQLVNQKFEGKAQFNCHRKSSKSRNLYLRIQSFILRHSAKNPIESACKLRFSQLHKALSMWAPELVISLKLQNEGYLFSLFLNEYAEFCDTPWIHFVWGSDIEYFAIRAPERDLHIPLITSTLSRCNFVITDTFRDAREVYNYGFQGKVLATTLAFGGFSDRQLEDSANSDLFRKIILVKGREGGLVGKASLVVEALKQIDPDLVKPFEIHFIMVTDEIRASIKDLASILGIKCVIHERIPYVEIIKLMQESLISISASTVDGSPGFLLESMAFGVIPVHSNQESIREWITDGVNGFLFDNTIEGLKYSIMRAITRAEKDKLINALNLSIIRDRASVKIVNEKIERAIEFALI